MDFNYTKIRLGNFLYKYCFPLYNISYSRFKLRNDKTEIALLGKMIRPGYHVLDIGANIGFYARVISSLVGPEGKVYCFEPDRLNYKYLLKNTSALANVKAFNLAVSDHKDVLKVYKSKLLNVDHRTYPVNNYDSVEEIGAVSIDELMQEGVIGEVDVVKIDIQGYELTAFKGMTRLLTSNPGLKIIAEYWPHGFKRAGSSAIAFYDFFDAQGFKFYLIDTGTYDLVSRDYILDNNDRPFEFSFNVLISRSEVR